MKKKIYIKFKDLTEEYIQIIKFFKYDSWKIRLIDDETYSVLEFGKTIIHKHKFVRLLRISDFEQRYIKKIIDYNFDQMKVIEVYNSKNKN